MADEEIIIGVDINTQKAEEKIQRLIKELTNLKIEEQNNSSEMRRLAREAGKFQGYIKEAKDMLERVKTQKGKDTLSKDLKENEIELGKIKERYNEILNRNFKVKDAIKSINSEIKNIKEEPIRRLEEAHKRAEAAAKAHAKAEAKIVSIATQGLKRRIRLENAEKREQERERNKIASTAARNFSRKAKINAAESRETSKAVNIPSDSNIKNHPIKGFISSVSNGISRLTSRIFYLASSAFVFNVISAGFRALSRELWKVIGQDAVFVTSLNNIKANLMTAFYPIYQAALPALRALGQMLTWLTGLLARFMAMLTGTSVSANQQGAKQMYIKSSLGNKANTRTYNTHVKSQARADKVKARNVSKAENYESKIAEANNKDNISKSANKAYDSAGKSAEDNAKKLAKFDKAATKSRKELAKFDKIDVLKQDKDKIPKEIIPKVPKEPKYAEVPEVAPFIPNMPILGGFKQQIPEFKLPFLDNIISKFKEISDLFLKGFDVGFVDKNFGEISKNLGRIWDSIKEIFNDPSVSEGFNRALGSMIYNLGVQAGSFASVGTTIGRLLVGGVANFLEQNGERIKEQIVRNFDISERMSDLSGKISLAFANIFEVFGSQEAQNSLGNILSGCETIVVDFAINVRDIMATLAESFFSPFIDHQDDIKQLFQGLLEALEPATNGIKTVCEDTADSLNSLTESSIKPAIKEIGKIWDDIVKSVLDVWNKYLSPVFKTISEKFKEIMESKVGENIKKTISSIGKVLNNVIKIISKIWNFLKPFIKWILEVAIDWLSTQFQNTATTVMNIIGDISDLIANISTILEGVTDFITGVFTGDWDKAWAGIGKIFDGFVGLIKTSINTLIDFINSMINAVTGGINTAIRAINKIGFDLPDWLGGHHFGLNIPEIPQNALNIPKLAQGSVLKGGNPFLAWVNDQPRGQTNIETPLDTIVKAFKAVSGNNSNQNIVIEASGDINSIIREFNFRLKNENKRIGTEIMVPSGAL